MFKVNRNSWHYTIARSWGDPWVDNSRSFCQYARHVISGVMKFSLITAFFGSILVFNLLGVVSIFDGVWSDQSIYGFVNILTLVIIFIFSLVYFNTKVQTWWEDYRETQMFKRYIVANEAPVDNPSFIKAWYQSIRDKVCIPVTFE